MSEIEIDVKAMIFDDPEFCHDYSNWCGYFRIENELWCGLYPNQNYLEKINRGNWLQAKKHDECKTSWQEAGALKKIKDLVNNQQESPPEFSRTVDDHFYDLI